MLYIQGTKLKYRHPNIHSHQGILKGKKLLNTVRNSTEINIASLIFRSSGRGHWPLGWQAEKEGPLSPLPCPSVQSSVNPCPHLFSHEHCEPSAEWTDFGFTSLSPSPAHTLMEGLRTGKTASRQCRRAARGLAAF